jgi:hypothetical protein
MGKIAMEHKVIKLKGTQDKMAELFEQIMTCTDNAKKKKLEARLIKIVDKNVKIVFGK